MRAFVICEGLTRECIGPEPDDLESVSHVGAAAMGRMMGEGRHYGNGALPMFLSAAARAVTADASLRLIAVAPGGESTEHGATRTSSLWPQPLRAPLENAAVVQAQADRVPWEAFRELLGDGTSCESDPDARILVVGTHTETQVLGTALFLRQVLGFRHVAVCSHLLASPTQDAHLLALRHQLPSAGVEVFLSLAAAARFVQVEDAGLESLGAVPCVIEPAVITDELGSHETRIIEMLCLDWSRVILKPLAGGFSGSRLYLAHGYRGDARTEPVVIKLDHRAQMRRELDGYHDVKDLLGKHVPTFGCPVASGETMGVAMELAAMEGAPQTLEDTFRESEGDESLGVFLARLDKALALISDRLYRNTQRRDWISPFRHYELHSARQLKYFRRNAATVIEQGREEIPSESLFDSDELETVLRIVTANEDAVESESCLVHGDFNYANTICDDGDNIWFIDWTHAKRAPIELDFAKLEADVKFVISDQFEVEDLSRLRAFEDFLLSHRMPPEPASLPESLKFAKWDLRYRKVLLAVRKIRAACFALKAEDSWLVYQVSLLKYALLTTSFNKRLGRGQCGLPQLLHAFYSLEALTMNLIGDDFHLKIRAERPESYPPRQRISIDEAPWGVPCPEYDPPYHVEPQVLVGGTEEHGSSWADPEDFALVAARHAGVEYRHRDEDGRPLNPRGRTGITGRGALGRWGANPAVACLVLRQSPRGEGLELLVSRWRGSQTTSIPRGFVLPTESVEAAVRRVVPGGVGIELGPDEPEVFASGYTYDSRQTDNAWVETDVHLCLLSSAGEIDRSLLSGDVEEAKWMCYDADTVNQLPSAQARWARKAAEHLAESQRMREELAVALIEGSG